MTLHIEIPDSAWDAFRRSMDSADIAIDAYLSRELEAILHGRKQGKKKKTKK